MYPEFSHPYFRSLYHEAISNPPIPPAPPEDSKPTSSHPDTETRQLDPAPPEPDLFPLAPITMDLSEDFRLDFSSAQMNALNGEADGGYNQFLAKNEDVCQLDNFKSDLPGAFFAVFPDPSEGLGFAPAVVPANTDVSGGESDLFDAFFTLDG